MLLKSKSKKFLLVLATSLLLASCGGDKPSPSETPSDNPTSESSTPIDPTDSGSSEEEASSSTPTKSSVDFTKDWDKLPALKEEISRYCGGNLIPFIDLQGDYHAVKNKKSGGIPSHLLIYTTGAFDRTLLYNTKVTYELAGWDVSFNLEAMTMDAEDSETGIAIKFYGEEDIREDGYVPYLEIYYSEVFRVPENGAWSTATKDVLASVGIQSPHMLPYCYLGAYAEEAVDASTTRKKIVTIKGGDWQAYEKSIVDTCKSSLSTSRSWNQSKGTKRSGGGKFTSNVYLFTKGFSDGYTLSCSLYGDTEEYYSSADGTDVDVYAYLEVEVTAPK